MFIRLSDSLIVNVEEVQLAYFSEETEDESAHLGIVLKNKETHFQWFEDNEIKEKDLKDMLDKLLKS